MTEGELLALPFLFEFWALEHQLPPDGDWRSWVIMGGRGAGKTRAGSEWVRAMVEGPRPLDRGRAKRVALVGETMDQVREVMVFGESGILACSPPDRRPSWSATRRCLTWPNGAEAMAYSAHDPEGLRGPQFDAAWVDELVTYLDGNRRLFDDAVNAIPGLKSMNLEATYLAWVDFAGTGMPMAAVVKRVQTDACIAVNHGPTFGKGGDSFLRFNIATPRARVEEACGRLKAAFKDLQ